MKKLLFILLILFLLLPAAVAEKVDLTAWAQTYLTESLGYSKEEAKDFVFEAQPDGSLRFWPQAHPSWVYITYTNEIGHPLCDIPFATGFTGTKDENTIRDLLKLANEKGWFRHWDGQAHEAFMDAMKENAVRFNTDIYFAQTGCQAVQAFFECCYGPDAMWPDALTELRDSVLAQNDLTWQETPFHVPGVRRTRRLPTVSDDVERTLTLFDSAAPEELAEAFAAPFLAGWTVQSGAAVYYAYQDEKQNSGFGLAAFEKDGKRQLALLTARENQWSAVPLGENALYPTGDYRVTFGRYQNSLAIQYSLNEGETAAFYVDLYLATKTSPEMGYCRIENYEYTNRKTKEAVWIDVSTINQPTWYQELFPYPDGTKYPTVPFPAYLGQVPISEFPTTLQEAKDYTYPGLPENCTLSSSVNLRTQTSSQSRSLGVLKAWSVLPVLETLPGTSYPWIHTKVGFLEGYVASNYTLGGVSFSPVMAPQPVAKAKREITLKNGTGLFAGTVASFPAGTKMHVVMEDSDWLYVDVPRGEMEYLMDPEGAFGYVKKEDVLMASMICMLDWTE